MTKLISMAAHRATLGAQGECPDVRFGSLAAAASNTRRGCFTPKAAAILPTGAAAKGHKRTHALQHDRRDTYPIAHDFKRKKKTASQRSLRTLFFSSIAYSLNTQSPMAPVLRGYFVTCLMLGLYLD